ncbi:MAG: type II toxin-antitoxin system mRNA interferase toxin, RelE/StbE family [Thermodesulfobacteriota bacterium]|nr:type II toxin-antitoxin system mRNA interferase toxin, RelE/StbE family [Thermodesulfobacteriota bacterium]
MIEAIWDSGFKRAYRKKVKVNPRLQGRFWRRLEEFLKDPFSAPLRTHKLSGKLAGQWAFSVDEHHRVLFEFIGDDSVLLIDVGTHDEVY